MCMINLITRFKSVDLRPKSEENILDLISEIGKTPVMLSEYHDSKHIYRARPNDNEHDDFINISDLSYKPQAFNKTYQRASTPQKTMFYGAIVPEDKDGEIIDDERIIGAFEVVGFLRDSSKKIGEKTLTYGVWRVNSTISAPSIFNSKTHEISVNWLKEVAESFYEELEEYPEYQEDAIVLHDYLSKEFSKHVPEKVDYQYKISSIYSRRATELGADGILYPSVKLKGAGLNIALTPDCVDSKMTLEYAVKCKVYKKSDRVILNNLKTGRVNYATGIIDWSEIPIGEHRQSEKDIRKELAKIIYKPKHRKSIQRKVNQQLLMRKRSRKRLKRK